MRRTKHATKGNAGFEGGTGRCCHWRARQSCTHAQNVVATAEEASAGEIMSIHSGRTVVRIRGTLGDIDPLNKVPVERATRRVQKGPL